MRIAKKITGILTAMVCAAGTVCGGYSLIAEAADISEEMLYGDYLYYVAYDEDENGIYDYVEITGCDEAATEVEIPAEIDGLPVTGIGWGSFHGCTNLVSITIPDSVTSIEDELFYGCTSLTSITIPDGVTSIGSEAFSKCTSLASITIPDGVTSIGSEAFSKCTSLASITIPDSVTEIGPMAFDGTALLDNQTGPLYYADKWIIGCDKDVTSAEIKDGTKCIGWGVFYGCTNLESVVIPDSVTSIGNAVFCGCTSLESAIIPDSVTSIGSGIFYGCEQLKEVTLSNNITSLDNYDSGDWDDIYKGFFEDCSSLVSITIPDSVANFGDEAFYGCTSLERINASENNEYFCSIDGILFSKDKTELIRYPEGNKNTDYFIPDSVTNIGNQAFFDCESLASITIPDSVTNIGDYAFANCKSLEIITIPDSVTSIGSSAFSHCESLESITIENPECEIYDSQYTISNGTDEISYYPYFNGTIYGCENSTAQAYAGKCGYEFRLIGDINIDGAVNIADIVMLQNFIINKEIIYTEEMIANEDIGKTDLNSDGKTNIFDVIYLKRLVLDL